MTGDVNAATRDGLPIILVAEDDPDDRLLTREALEECGLAAHLRFVGDGDELLDYLHRQGAYAGAGPGEAPCPTLILLDLNMPRRNGHEALKAIKADALLRRIPAVVLTTSRDEEDITGAYAEGAASYLVKPRTFEGLVQMMRGLKAYWFTLLAPTTGAAGAARRLRNLSRFPAAPRSAVKTEPRPKEEIRVLVVDDDGEDYLIARDLLAEIEGVRFTVAWAADRAQALAQLAPSGAATPAAARHDICLLDYRLGRDCGLEVLREAREGGFTGPVIILTGQDDREVDQAALDSGASDYLVKGRIDAPLLERAIRYALAQKRSEEQLRASADALAAARRREVEVGATIQQTLLTPRLPDRLLPGISIGARTIGTETIDGDFYDLFLFGERCLDVVVGDVMGKGITAALVGAAVKSTMTRVQRLLTVDLHPYGRLPWPEEIVGALHRLMTPDLIEMHSYATLDYARFDLSERRLLLVDCGHPRVLHWRAADGSRAWLAGDNMPLGLVERETHTSVPVPFETGDLFVFCSDGVFDAERAARAEGGGAEYFGEARVAAFVAGRVRAGDSTQEIADGLCDAVRQFAGGDPVTMDDLTCVVVQIEAEAVEVARVPVPISGRALRVAEFPARADALHDLRDFVEGYCRTHGSGVTAADGADMARAVREAAARVVADGYAEGWESRDLSGTGNRARIRRAPTLQVEAETFDGRVRLRLRDAGVAFELPPAPPPAFDAVSYGRDQLGRNVLTLERRRERGAAPAASPASVTPASCPCA